MKKSTNFNQGRNKKYRGRNEFVGLAKGAGVPDGYIIKSVTRIELEAIKRAEGSIPPFNHKHCFDSDGKCSCGLLEEFYDEGEEK